VQRPPVGREENTQVSRRNTAFTLFELMMVVAIIAVVAAMAASSWRVTQQNNRIRTMAREISGAMEMARSHAIQEEAIYGVYVSLGAGRNQDLCGNPLNPNRVATIFLDNGGGGPVVSNCCVDPAERSQTFPRDDGAANGLAWGATWAPGTVPTDQGTTPGNLATGTSFPFIAGGTAPLILFRPDGVPVQPSAVCAQGQVGSGTGAFYLTTQSAGPNAVVTPGQAKDYAVVISPLGATRIHTFERSANQWTN